MLIAGVQSGMIPLHCSMVKMSHRLPEQYSHQPNQADLCPVVIVAMCKGYVMCLYDGEFYSVSAFDWKSGEVEKW